MPKRILPLLTLLLLNQASAFAESTAIDWKPYIIQMQRAIKKNWHPPRNDTPYQVVMTFNIHHNGHISNIKAKGYQDKLALKAAIAAVKETDPLPGLPKEFKEAKVPVEFTMDYWPQCTKTLKNAPAMKHRWLK